MTTMTLDGKTLSTETEVWPEVDAHVQLPSHLRVLAVVYQRR